MTHTTLFPNDRLEPIPYRTKKWTWKSEKIRDIISSQRFSPRSIISHDASDTGDPTSGQRGYPIL
jgi:hypothetical protein